ncbi:AMP-binding protein [bacterium]|nr:AMP-binding protein [bacterium]
MTSQLLTALRRHAGRTALETPDGLLTYDELAEAVERAQPLLNGAATVALMMQNCAAWVVMDLACIRAAISMLPLPSFFSEKQTAHALHDAGIDTVFTDQPERFHGTAEPVELAGKPFWRIRLAHAPQVALPSQTAKITYTSGTSDEPRGVCLTQGAMERLAASLIQTIAMPDPSRHVCLLPLAVLLENIAGVYAALLMGATVCLPPVEHTPDALHAAIEWSGATSCILVPELLRMLLAVNRPLPSLHYAAVGGARVAPELIDAALDRGLPVYEGYGLTEAASVVAVNTPAAFKVGSAGRLLPHIRMRRAKDGELELHHPLFSGYLGDAKPVPEWYPTGDIGHVDEDGFLHIDGRKKNLYITSFGRNVSPEWVESLLTAHPAIAQALVYGEARPFATAIIVPRNPQAVDDAIAQVNRQLPDYARIGAHVLAQPFTPHNGQLTGTGKPRRETIHQAYAHHIESCYQRENV